jgi:hypothetical protein
MPTPQLALPQQFGRFLLAGALVFALLFWISSWFLISSPDAHRDLLAVRVILKSGFLQPFANWLRDIQAAYIPFFFRQRPLLACYLISLPMAWLAAFIYDTKILRKENIL